MDGWMSGRTMFRIDASNLMEARNICIHHRMMSKNCRVASLYSLNPDSNTQYKVGSWDLAEREVNL